MAEERVWIVEDEAIVAIDIKTRLLAAGYQVAGISSYAEDAIEQIRREQPDIVLMDIVLKGEMDGITAAEIIRDEMEIPVIYLTAYAEEKTISRAKVTEPFGYILKPFEERDLTITLEMALYKASIERRLRESERWIKTMIRSMGEAVIATDTEAMVKFMNPVAESLTGIREEEAIGAPSEAIFTIEVGTSGHPAPDPVLQAFRDETTITSELEMVLRSADGSFRFIEYTAAPIRGERGNPDGAVLIFHDITERVMVDEELRRHREHLEELVSERTEELRKANAKLQQMLHYIEMIEKRWVEDMLLSEVADIGDDAMPPGEGIISIDTDLHVVLINQIGEEMTGWNQREAADQPVSSILSFDHTSGNILDCLPGAVLAQGESRSFGEDCFLRTRLQEKIPIWLSIEPIRDQKGVIIGATLTIQRVR